MVAVTNRPVLFLADTQGGQSPEVMTIAAIFFSLRLGQSKLELRFR